MMNAAAKPPSTPAHRVEFHRQKLQRSPNDPETLESLGSLYTDLGEHHLAAQCFHSLAQLLPSSAPLRLKFAEALARINNPEKSRCEFDAALQIDPDSIPALLGMGNILAKLNRQDEAQASLRRALELAPDHYEIHAALARSLHHAGKSVEAIDVWRQAVRRWPDKTDALCGLSQTLVESDKPKDAILSLQDSLRRQLNSPDLWNALGTAQMIAGQFLDAEKSFEKALDLRPSSVHSHANYAVALKRQGRLREAAAVIEQVLRMHRARPGEWQPTFSREVAELSLFPEQGDSALQPIPAKLFTVIIGCYGHFPEYSLRALESIQSGIHLDKHGDFLIGLNECAPETVARARALCDCGTAQGLVESKRNINKDPMMRLLIEMTQTPYVLWLDDDSHFVDPHWPEIFADVIAAKHPFDAGGQYAKWGPRRDLDPEFMTFIRARPWWRGNEHFSPELREWVPFPVGGMFVVRTQFLRKYDFPDRGMIKAMDDVALGELIQHVAGRLVAFPRHLLDTVKISDGHRRGTNFLLKDGWKHGQTSQTTTLQSLSVQ